MNLKKLSLQQKLLAMVATVVVVLSLEALGLVNMISSDLKNSRQNAFHVHAETLGNAIEAQFFERYGDVQAFAINPVF